MKTQHWGETPFRFGRLTRKRMHSAFTSSSLFGCYGWFKIHAGGTWNKKSSFYILGLLWTIGYFLALKNILKRRY